MKCTCKANGSTYILYGFLNKKKHLRFCFIVMKMLFIDIIILKVNKIFEMFPMQTILPYMPQRDPKLPGGI